MELNTNEIAEVEISRYSMLLMILPLFKCLKIYKKDGSSIKINVAPRKGWKVAISALLK
jgi:hypothetical protein